MKYRVPNRSAIEISQSNRPTTTNFHHEPEDTLYANDVLHVFNVKLLFGGYHFLFLSFISISSFRSLFYILYTLYMYIIAYIIHIVSIIISLEMITSMIT